MKNHFGKCALCGKECQLTFEHIPPRKAFNWMPAKPITGEKIVDNKDRIFPWDIEGIPYSNQQKGMGLPTLCSDCNNNTGAWYGNEYVEFAKCCHSIICDREDFLNKMVHVDEFYPLRFIKQVASMFCSIAGIDADVPSFDAIVFGTFSTVSSGIAVVF